MNDRLVVSYHNKMPYITASICAVAGALYLAYAILTIGTGYIFIANFVALIAAAVLLFTYAKYKSKCLVYAFFIFELASLASLVFYIVDNAIYLQLGGTVVLWFAMGIAVYVFKIAAVVLSGLALGGILKKKITHYIIYGFYAATVVARYALEYLMLSTVAVFRLNVLILSIADIALAAFLIMLMVSVKPFRVVVIPIRKAHKKLLVKAKEEIFPIKICESCGKLYYYEQLSFCENCGQKLSELDVNSPLRKGNFYCEKCDFSTNDNEMEYCVKCGAQLINAKKTLAAISSKEAAERIEKMQELLSKGIVTQAEYDEKRAKLIKYL